MSPRTVPVRTRGSNKQRSAVTRAALVDAAAREFAVRGYAATSIDVIVERATVTKGAFYHHFDSKQSILEAVVQRIQSRLRLHILRNTRSIVDPWAMLERACDIYLHEATRDHAVHNLLILEAPSVLGWRRWREIDDRHWRSGLDAALMRALGGYPAEAASMSTAIAGCLTSAVLNIASAAERGQATEEAEQLMALLLKSFQTYAASLHKA